MWENVRPRTAQLDPREGSRGRAERAKMMMIGEGEGGGRVQDGTARTAEAQKQKGRGTIIPNSIGFGQNGGNVGQFTPFGGGGEKSERETINLVPASAASGEWRACRRR